MARVVVQIVTYNSCIPLPTCLAALAAQTYRDFLLVVVDNASQDDSLRLARESGAICQANEENRGYAVAHNQALAMAESDYVLTLNPDTCLDPDYLAAMVAALDQDAMLGAAAGLLWRVDHLGQVPHIIDSTGLGLARTRRQHLLSENLPIEAAPHQSRPIFGPDGAAAFYRRTMLTAVAVEGEVFDEDFFMHKEDVDLCWRLQGQGWRAVYVPTAQAQHIRAFRPGQRDSVSREVRFWAVRNRYLMAMKNETWGTFWRDWPFIIAYDLAILVYLALFERASLAAVRSAWRLRQRMWHKRRIIQARRTISARELSQRFKLRP